MSRGPGRLEGFLRELRRRRVFRVAVAYAVVAWAVIEVASVVFPALEMPYWALKLVVLLALLGVPIALVLAWAFQVTPEGVRLHDEAAAPAGTSSSSRGIWLLVGLVAVGVGGWYALRGGGTAPEPERLDPNAVAVAPFRVAGADPSLAYLREGMIDLLAAKLTGGSGPRAVDPRTLLHAWRERAGATDADLPPERALEVARVVGAGRLLLGEVVGGGSQLVLTASLLDAATGEVVERASRTGEVDSLLAVVDRLAAEILLLEAGESEHRLEHLTSRSLPAVRAYLDGRAAYRHGRYEEAIEAFGAALERDSTFALAGLGLGEAAAWTAGNAEERRTALGIAWRHRDRLGERDRAYLRVIAALAGIPEPVAGAELLRLATEVRDLIPDRPEAWLHVGDRLFHQGLALEEPDAHGRAATAFQRALELDPSFVPAIEHAFHLALKRHDSAEVRLLADLYLAHADDSDFAPSVRLFRDLMLGDSAAVAASQAMIDTLPPPALAAITWVAPYVGMGMAEAERAWARRSPPSPTWRQGVLLARGRPAEAAAVPAQMGDERVRWPHPIFTALYLHGDTVAAARVARAGADAVVAAVSADTASYPTLVRACLTEWWRISRGEPGHAARLASALTRATGVAENAAQQVTLQLCGTLLSALVAVTEELPDARARVGELDRLLRAVPPTPREYRLAANFAALRLHDALG
ncbi:MAG TPA: hypothetical protein VMK65_13380, partial [Longimicrobiales bacterium]|nr:hypothetical protein [Longimicrobiales bacterium]